MTAQIKLKATIRKKKEKMEDKKVASVVYGPEIKENKNLWVSEKDFKKIYDEVGESSLVDLEIEGEKEPYEVLIYDTQVDPITEKYQHIDFFKVKRGKKLETEVELNFVGQSPAVKEAGAVLVKNNDYLEIRCLPKDLPKEIKVDLGLLKKIDDVIQVKDLDIPEGVEVLIDLETVVAMADAPRTEEELDKLDEKVEVDMEKIGTSKEKKEGAEEDDSAKKEGKTSE